MAEDGVKRQFLPYMVHLLGAHELLLDFAELGKGSTSNLEASPSQIHSPPLNVELAGKDLALGVNKRVDERTAIGAVQGVGSQLAGW